METFKLWLEQDDVVPEFKRLAYEKVEVSLADVLLNGIHPWQGHGAHPSLQERFLGILNEESAQMSQLAQLGHCVDITIEMYRYYGGYRGDSSFEVTLERIRSSVRFVEGLTYPGLVKIAKRRLQKAWSHKTARSLLSFTSGSFDAMRALLKKKDKTVKLSGYDDLDNYDLGKILSLDDFSSEDLAIICEGVPVTNFRPATFISRVADKRGHLTLVDEIRDFQLAAQGCSGSLTGNVVYNGRRNGDTVRLIPEINRVETQRALAKAFSARWEKGNDRYCVTTDVAGLTEMSEQPGCKITFPTLNYSYAYEGKTSRAEIAKSKTPRFAVERFLTASAPGDAFKAALRSHGVSMTGRKANLVEKLAKLSADLYAEKKPELDKFYQEQRFIRAKAVAASDSHSFPVLEEFDLKGMILSMYVIKHLRGNTILDATHENDTFDLLSLARSLIKGEVSIQGVFLRVE